MPLSLTELVAPSHTALVLQEVQNGVVGTPSVLPALSEAAAAVDLIGNCARLARAARAAGIPVFHCTAETRDDGKGANRNARFTSLIFGTRPTEYVGNVLRCSKTFAILGFRE